MRAIILSLLLAVAVEQSITPRKAKEYVGQNKTVCGVVASARYAERTKGEPTFINLDEPYPNQIFTVVIWGSNRSKFGTPERELSGKRVCVSGLIGEHKGVPQIEATEKEQIKVE